MSLSEFLASLAQHSQRKRVLAVLYYLEVVKGRDAVSSTEIRETLVSGRAKGAKSWNIPAVLGRAVPNVETTATDAQGRHLWQLTASGRSHVATYIDTSRLAQEGAKLQRTTEFDAIREVVAKISNADAQEYASEALDCLSVDADRAAIVFMWVAATHELQERCWAKANPATISTAAQRHNSRAKTLKKRDDLSEYNEALLLQVAHDIGVLDKNEKS